MKIVVLIVIIAVLIIIFPQGTLSAFLNAFTVGAVSFGRTVSIIFPFVLGVLNPILNSTYLYTLICIFFFINVFLWVIRWIRGSSKDGLGEGDSSDIDLVLPDEMVSEETMHTDNLGNQYVRTKFYKMTGNKKSRKKVYLGDDKTYTRRKGKWL